MISETPFMINAIDRAALRFMLGMAWESMPEVTFSMYGKLAKELYRQLSADVSFGSDDIETLYYRDPARVARASEADRKLDLAPEYL